MISPRTRVAYFVVKLELKSDFYAQFDRIKQGGRWYFSCEDFLALIVETCFFLLMMVVFTLFLTAFIYVGVAGYSKIIRLFWLQKMAVRVVFEFKGSQTCRSVFRNRNHLNFRSIYILEYVIQVKQNRSLFTVPRSFLHPYNLNIETPISLPRSGTTFNLDQSSSFCARLFGACKNGTKLNYLDVVSESIRLRGSSIVFMFFYT